MYERFKVMAASAVSVPGLSSCLLRLFLGLSVSMAKAMFHSRPVLTSAPRPLDLDHRVLSSSVVSVSELLDDKVFFHSMPVDRSGPVLLEQFSGLSVSITPQRLLLGLSF
jgi:hypothetical protein